MSSSDYSAATVVLTGPTGVGKTLVGIEVARRIGGEVLSADSRQIYRGLDIGTAKPTADERRQVRHHLVDVVEPHESYSAGRFGREARRLAAELHGRGLVPVVVGGSGLYLSAFMDGFCAAEEVSGRVRSELRRRLQADGLPSLYAELGRLDPVLHARLHPRDQQRILRALELAHGGGGRAVHQYRAGGGQALPHIPVAICLSRPRPVLYRRIDRRVEAMVAAGWPAEVESLLAAGCDPAASGLQSLGYGEMARLAAGELSVAAAIAAVQVQSRRYAKRQLTWFRRDRRLRWLDLERLGPTGATERIVADWRRRLPPAVQASAAGAGAVWKRHASAS